MIRNYWTSNKEFRIFIWTVFNVSIAFASTQLLGLEGTNAILATWLAIPFLNAITKFVNVKYFWDIWVAG